MFKCKACGSDEFTLMVQPGYAGTVEFSTSEHGDVVVHAGGREFTADLMFMNQFAVCAQCNAIKKWAYFFPEQVANTG